MKRPVKDPGGDMFTESSAILGQRERAAHVRWWLQVSWTWNKPFKPPGRQTTLEDDDSMPKRQVSMANTASSAQDQARKRRSRGSGCPVTFGKGRGHLLMALAMCHVPRL